MDITHKSTKILLVLIQGTCLAISNTHFWVGAGYDFSTQAFSIDSKIIPDELAMQIPPLDRIPLTLDESGFFMAVEAEKHISSDFSSSVKFMFYHPEKSALKPLIVHTSGTILETYGKYHYNQFTYLLGYSIQHDFIKFSTFSGNYKSECNRIISSVAVGTELSVSPNARLSFSTFTTIPFFDEVSKKSIMPHSKYNVRVGLAYSLDSL